VSLPVPTGPDPAERIEGVYQRILHERMQGLPMLNAALRVEAVDFQPWHRQWLGALVTPWTMLLVLMPNDSAAWQSVSDNRRRFVEFPAGKFAFLGNVEPEVGEYQTCSLFAQMSQFPAQHVAIMTARASLVSLLSTRAAQGAESVKQAAAVQAAQPSPLVAGKTSRDAESVQASRRRFLFLRSGRAGLSG
jgi:[NiFe] hydrogenase assembly HybE family chaperone